MKPIGESNGLKINGYDGDGQADCFDIPAAGQPWPEVEEARRTDDWRAFKAHWGASDFLEQGV